MDHVILLKEHLKDLNSRGEHIRGIPSERTDKIETEVQEIFERMKPLVAGQPLKYVVIHKHKTRASAASAKIFFQLNKFELWNTTMSQLDPEDVVYGVDRTLIAHIKIDNEYAT